MRLVHVKVRVFIKSRTIFDMKFCKRENQSEFLNYIEAIIFLDGALEESSRQSPEVYKVKCYCVGQKDSQFEFYL